MNVGYLDPEQRDLIAFLEDALEKARNGTVQAAAFVCLGVNAVDSLVSYSSYHAGGLIQSNRVGVIGALQILSADLVRAAQDDADEAADET